MKVFLSPIAARKIEILLDYLELEWSKKSRESFLLKLKKRIAQISKYPKSCIESKEVPNLFKCRVSEQTSFFYRIESGEIEIITLIDNRQDPEKISEEISRLFGKQSTDSTH